mmetsp:Transcript_20382/g.46805  ORF Transcript_20382/g.46805 Transcript_20382/m.46805 type:complete len:227 (-) Transcript_20382:1659-2339(-)
MLINNDACTVVVVPPSSLLSLSLVSLEFEASVDELPTTVVMGVTTITTCALFSTGRAANVEDGTSTEVSSLTSTTTGSELLAMLLVSSTSATMVSPPMDTLVRVLLLASRLSTSDTSSLSTAATASVTTLFGGVWPKAPDWKPVTFSDASCNCVSKSSKKASEDVSNPSSSIRVLASSDASTCTEKSTSHTDCTDCKSRPLPTTSRRRADIATVLAPILLSGSTLK